MTNYLEIRKTSIALCSKYLTASRAVKYDILLAAKRLTLPSSGRTLVFADEADIAAFADYQMFEFPVNGRTLIATVEPLLTDLTELETDILRGWQRQRTSLFRVTGVHPGDDEIELQDLLEPGLPPFRLSDVSLAKSLCGLSVFPILFTRIVEVRGYRMSSGSFFSFHPEVEPGLLQAYRQKMKLVPPDDLSERRFIFFYRKNRQMGVDRALNDLP
ncbi:MAG: hypothetical protein JNL10_08985 [Verrucomicrobiales bacterium]|nr:hypothetical protein [Verrucomicrobiales bacterium]